MTTPLTYNWVSQKGGVPITFIWYILRLNLRGGEAYATSLKSGPTLKMRNFCRVLIVIKLSLIVLKLQERVWREECWWLKTFPRIGQQSFQGWKRHLGPQILQWGSRCGASFKRYNLRQQIRLEQKQISIIYIPPLGPELALALANRSAAHVRLANWGQALTDIDMALSAKFAHPNPAKLMERKVKCQQMLGKAISTILRH